MFSERSGRCFGLYLNKTLNSNNLLARLVDEVLPATVVKDSLMESNKKSHLNVGNETILAGWEEKCCDHLRAANVRGINAEIKGIYEPT